MASSEPWSSWSGNTVILLTRSELSRLLLGLLITAEKMNVYHDGLQLKRHLTNMEFLWIHLFYGKNACKFTLIHSTCLHKYKHVSLPPQTFTNPWCSRQIWHVYSVALYVTCSLTFLRGLDANIMVWSELQSRCVIEKRWNSTEDTYMWAWPPWMWPALWHEHL